MPDVERAETADLDTCINHLSSHDEPLVRRLALLASELQGEVNLRDADPVQARLDRALVEIARLRSDRAEYVNTHRHAAPVMDGAGDDVDDDRYFADHPWTTAALGIGAQQ